MAEGLVVFSRTQKPFAVADRDLINGAINGQWMAVAKQSGMTYRPSDHVAPRRLLQLPSAYETCTIAATPYGKDIVRPFAAAVHAAGLKLGFYYLGRDRLTPIT